MRAITFFHASLANVCAYFKIVVNALAFSFKKGHFIWAFYTFILRIRKCSINAFTYPINLIINFVNPTRTAWAIYVNHWFYTITSQSLIIENWVLAALDTFIKDSYIANLANTSLSDIYKLFYLVWWTISTTCIKTINTINKFGRKARAASKCIFSVSIFAGTKT